MMHRAIAIDKSIFTRPLEEKGDHERAEKFRIQLFLPPTDIPSHIESTYDQRTDIFTIGFKYTQEEPMEKIIDHDDYSLIVGKLSGKAMMITIKNAKQRNIQEIVLERIIKHDIAEIISKNLSYKDKVRERENLIRASETIQKSAQELLVTS